jgi:hypothetical protein
MTPRGHDEPFRLVPLPVCLWGVARMARELRANERTIRRWMRQGRVPKPCLRRDGRSYWDPAQVEPYRRERLEARPDETRPPGTQPDGLR